VLGVGACLETDAIFRKHPEHYGLCILSLLPAPGRLNDFASPILAGRLRTPILTREDGTAAAC